MVHPLLTISIFPLSISFFQEVLVALFRPPFPQEEDFKGCQIAKRIQVTYDRHGDLAHALFVVLLRNAQPANVSPSVTQCAPYTMGVV